MANEIKRIYSEFIVAFMSKTLNDIKGIRRLRRMKISA
jgi:hypothetical protein